MIDQAPDLPEHVQRVIEANFKAIVAFKPKTYAGKLTLLRARGGRLLVTHDPLMGWGQFVTGSVEVRQIPGSHLRLFHRSHVVNLANRLQQCLYEAQGEAVQGETVQGETVQEKEQQAQRQEQKA